MTTDNQEENTLRGISLLRDRLLPNLLNEDEKDILYWAGKELARSYSLSSLEEITQLMADLAFGEVSLIKKRKNTLYFVLSGTIIEKRLALHNDPSFSLETGFLAEAIQQVTADYTEGSYETSKKDSSVMLTIQSDRKVSLDQ